MIHVISRGENNKSEKKNTEILSYSSFRIYDRTTRQTTMDDIKGKKNNRLCQNDDNIMTKGITTTNDNQ